ncbi:MAG: hypothetical protein IMZ43_01575 [Thermoplasmata archaeon]|nr:hypothetical protein [Thermoplasmata archaeon]
MTPHPQPRLEYLIPEDLWVRMVRNYFELVESGSLSAIEEADTYQIMRALQEVCRYPHTPQQSERDAVLDTVCEILKHEWNNSNALIREQKDERQIAVLHIRNQVAELRSTKGDPP